MGRRYASVGIGLLCGLSGCEPNRDGGQAKPAPNVDASRDAKAADKTDVKTDGKTDETPTKTPTKTPTDPPAVADPEAAEPDTPAKPTTTELRADVHESVEIDGGVILKVAAQAEQPKSTLWVERTASGIPPERFILRTTTGKVEDLVAVWDGTSLWVAWRSAVASKTGGDARALVASAGYDAKLASVGKAKILRSFVPGGELAEGSVVMRARTGGGATVAALAGFERCFSDIEEAQTTCPRLQVDVIGSAGAVVRTETRSLDGGDAGVDALIDAETGAVVAFHSYRGGPLTDVTFVPYDPAASTVSIAACSYPTIDLAFVMDTIVSMCPDPDSDNPDQFEDGCKGEPRSSCGTIGVSDRAGAWFPPSVRGAPQVPLRAVAAACDEGRGMLELSWAKDGPRAAGSIRVPTGASCK